MQKIRNHSLYLVISEEYGNGLGAMEIARRAIAGGVDIIQMREKDKDAEELMTLGKNLSHLCKNSRVTFIVNDDPLLAKKAGADGVHLGQEDIKKYPIEETRKILGEDRIIGVSTHSVEQFKEANEKEFDYIAFGPLFETKTKDYFLGTDDVGEVARIAKGRVFFIGGINLLNIESLLQKGAKNIALIRGILEADDIASQTKRFKDAIKEGVKYGYKDKR
jgi:thiamine-phosphate pyrophosphorylase